MVVNSINFWFFFAIVLVVYYGLFRKSARWQNITLLVASYVFYGMVDWKMCLLLFAATAAFFGLGIAIDKNNADKPKRASRLTAFGVCLGVGMLVYFKYLNFFMNEFSRLLGSFGLNTNWNTFNIIMPLGISFFTFKLIGYVIEVHRENMKATKDPVAFGTFIAYFPTIMSGPIDNPTKFIPQLGIARTVNSDTLAEAGKRILWGMFLKMCIADQLSGYTGAILGNYEHQNASSIIMASILYSFQLYTDFCGYSEMAIGVSQIMGIKVAENFNRPFFAQNMAEWWRRWHMSLTTWITNYIYMPLNIAFRNLGMFGIYAAAILNLVIIGIWHGDNWTYALFGLYHGIIIAFVTYIEKPRKKFEKKHDLKNKAWWKYLRIVFTFILWTIGQVIFQAKSVGDFFGTMGALGNGFGHVGFDRSLLISMLGIVFLIVVDNYNQNKPVTTIFPSVGILKNDYIRAFLYAMFFIIIMTFGKSESQFIYFQF